MYIHTGDPILKLLLAGSYNPLLFNFNKILGTCKRVGMNSLFLFW